MDYDQRHLLSPVSIEKEPPFFPATGSPLFPPPQEPVGISSSDGVEEEKDTIASTKQLVLYDPSAHSLPDLLRTELPPPKRAPSTSLAKILPSIGAFTVQCANCFKWRLIPTKERYEEIREHILERPFYCETAREWRPEVTCDDPTDISQDGSRLWAIDRPSISQPPPGWQRQLRIRGEGGTKFADVYYVAPSGKTLRSMVEIQKYLMDHPEFMVEGVSLARFSFQIPKPLQEDYVRKRPRLTSSDNTRPLESGQSRPFSWVGPDNETDLQLTRPTFPAPASLEGPIPDLFAQPAKKQSKKPPKKMYRSQPEDNQKWTWRS